MFLIITLEHGRKTDGHTIPITCSKAPRIRSRSHGAGALRPNTAEGEGQEKTENRYPLHEIYIQCGESNTREQQDRGKRKSCGEGWMIDRNLAVISHPKGE